MNIGDKKCYLTLLQRVEKRNGSWYGLFRCDCGQEKIIRISAVGPKGTWSCGCYSKIVVANNGRVVATHNLSKHPLYRIWTTFKKNKNRDEICQEWLEFINFYNWAIDKWKRGFSITRYNNSQQYCADNCYFEEKEKLCLKLRKQTNLVKYGTEFPQTTQEVKDRIKQTNLIKYGYENHAQSPKVKQNTIDNNRKKYGVDYPQQLPENRQKCRQLTINNGQAFVLDGLTTPQWAEKLQLSNAALVRRIHKYGFEKAINMEKGISGIESIIKQILEEQNIKFEHQYMFNGKSADFFLPEQKLIIEADGLYWHSDAVNKNKYYHRNKQKVYEDCGYTSLFFRENEIEDKSLIVRSIILNKLNKSTKVFARKCIIERLDKKAAKTFLIENHLMENGRGDSFVLKYDGRIVSLIQVMMRKNILEISRFCNMLNYSVVGGFSKLLKAVEKEFNPQHISTFIDKRYGKGLYLYDLGFKKINEDLSFVWVKNDKVFHRLKYRGNSGYELGMYKLWDCGQIKFIK